MAPSSLPWSLLRLFIQSFLITCCTYATDSHSDIFWEKKPTSCPHSHLVEDVEAPFSRIPHHHTWFFQKEVEDLPTIWLTAGTELNLKVFPLSGKINVKKAQTWSTAGGCVFPELKIRGNGCFDTHTHTHTHTLHYHVCVSLCSFMCAAAVRSYQTCQELNL